MKLHSGNKKEIAGFSVLLLSCVFFLFSCGDGDKILVGFSGPLTGKYSDLGVQGRNGATLAIEEINAQGGLDGRKLELISKDDCCSPQAARKADRELIEKGVVAIIGHMTSGQSMAALPLAEKAGVVMLSPTTSTPRLSGKKDMFFRVHASSGLTARALGRFAREKLGLERMSTVRDMSNDGFSSPFNHNFMLSFVKNGAGICAQCEFSSTKANSWEKVLKCLEEENPDGVLIIASARDTADFIQVLREKSLSLNILSSGWAATNELLALGGKSIEGLYLGKTKYPTEKPKIYEKFKDNFRKRFGREPSFASIQGYNAVKLLGAALKDTEGRRKGLAEALTNVRGYSDFYSPPGLNEYGDALAPVSILKISEGEFQEIDKMRPRGDAWQ